MNTNNLKWSYLLYAYGWMWLNENDALSCWLIYGLTAFIVLTTVASTIVRVKVKYMRRTVPFKREWYWKCVPFIVVPILAINAHWFGAIAIALTYGMEYYEENYLVITPEEKEIFIEEYIEEKSAV